MKRYTLAAVAALLVLFPWRSALRADAVSYTVDTLGTIDGLVPAVTGINASGQISGYVNGSSGSRAVRYTDGVGWAYLPGLAAGSVATGINVHGDLSGYYQTSTGTHAFRYRDGTGLEDIAPLPQGTGTLGMAINDNGDVAGYSDTPRGSRGWRASPGLPAVELPTLGGSFAIACGINSSGQTAGASTTIDGFMHAYRIDADGLTTADAGSFDGPTGFSQACAIDDAGHIGGFAVGGGVFHAFRFLAPSQLLNLEGALDSVFGNVESIAGGASAGWFISASDGASHALLYTDANGAVDLGTLLPAGSGWVLFEAKGINTAGQIVGDGLFNGAPGVFRLTPAATDHTAPTITSLSATPSSIVPPNEAMVPVAIAVTATDDKDPSPVCTLTSIGGGASSDSSMTGPLAASVRATGGATYTLTVTCHDATGNSANGSVNVVVPPDTTPPVITTFTASPSTIWPPNDALVAVTTAIAATDDSGDAPACKLSGIASTAGTSADYSITGALFAVLRATGGRTYTLTATCFDAAGNHSTGSVNVVVPPDTTAPVITSLSASPSFVWPPNQKMTDVVVSVGATDDVDATPACALTSITGGAPGSAAITGAFTASVRASNGSVYSLNVTCSDHAGNASHRTVLVTIGKDPAAKSANAGR
ncbi:MAG TPA: hypothetical protein VEL79_01405 [Vicinamibacterales bacterium]|nr:hypothetical protein [Vicinamibacterales bacterium]